MPDKKFGTSHLYTLRMLQRCPIGKVMAAKMGPHDIVAHVKGRRNGTFGMPSVCGATVNQDITYLRGPFAYAKVGFGLEGVGVNAFSEAKPLLTRHKLTGKSNPRNVRPTQEQIYQLNAYLAEGDKHSKIPMVTVFEFARLTARRISEIFRLRWGDVNGEDMTCIVRDMKDPKNKIGNHHEFPLLGRAWDIVMAQPRVSPDNPDERIFPYRAKTAGKRFTEAKKALGIKNLRFHDNRREAASRLFEEGFSVPEVMLMTGHKTPQMLMRVYTKLNAADMHKGPASKRETAREAHARAIVEKRALEPQPPFEPDDNFELIEPNQEKSDAGLLDKNDSAHDGRDETRSGA